MSVVAGHAFGVLAVWQEGRWEAALLMGSVDGDGCRSMSLGLFECSMLSLSLGRWMGGPE